MKIKYKFNVMLEIDTETGKSRVLQQWGSPVGEGSKLQKPKDKELTTEQVTVLDL